MTASISTRIVLSFEKLSNDRPTTLTKQVSVLRTKRPHTPPFQGDNSIIHFHFTPCDKKLSVNIEDRKSFLIFFDAVLNVLAFTDSIAARTPLRAVNRWKQRTKISISSYSTSSRCTALVIVHVDRQMQHFLKPV